MTLKVGRAGRDSGLELLSPEKWDRDGSRASVRGNLVADDLNSLLVLAGQVNRLKDNPDEQFVPIEYSGDQSVTGMYRVLDSKCPMPERGIAQLRLRYELEVERVPDFYYPMVEFGLDGGVRTNSHSIAQGSLVPWHAVPSDIRVYGRASGVTQATRNGAEPCLVNYVTDGSTMIGSTSGPTLIDGLILPTDWYDSSARIEIDLGGGTFRTAVGRVIGQTSPTALRISNGHTRVTFPTVTVGGNAAGGFAVSTHNGTDWQTAKVYHFANDNPATSIDPIKAVRIVRNSPAEVIVKLWLGSTTSQTTVVLSLRRGSLYVSGRLYNEAGTDKYGIYRNTAEAATAHTSGVHATAPSGGGTYILTTPLAKTNDLTQGGFYRTSAGNNLDFMAGFQVTGASAPDDFTSQVYGYMAAQHETVRLTRR